MTGPAGPRLSPPSPRLPVRVSSAAALCPVCPALRAVPLAPWCLLPSPPLSPVVRVAADAVLPDTDFRIFGKPSVRPYRRMAVGLAHGPLDSDAHGLVAKAQEVAGKLSVG